MALVDTVRAYSTYSEGAVAKSFLEAHGVFAVIPDWYHATNAWHLANALQGICLCTIEIEAADARELLDTTLSTKPSERRPPVSEVILSAVIYLLAGIPHPVRRR
jgi:triphosphoribosyl-dephospho-CoA synthetase